MCAPQIVPGVRWRGATGAESSACSPRIRRSNPRMAPDGAQRPLPELGDEEAERDQRPTVGRHGEVVEVALDDLPQPFSLDWYWLVPAPSQLLFDGLQLRPHAVAPSLALDEELAPPRLAADEGEAQEVEGLRLAQPASLAARRRMAAELAQAGPCRTEPPPKPTPPPPPPRPLSPR